MKILFVCKSNFGRSQIAKTIFNSLSKNDRATSAGVEKGRTLNHKLKDFPEHNNLFLCMDEFGFDLRENTTRLLSKYMVEDADKIIAMAPKETLPDYLKYTNKVTYWDIDDICGLSLDGYRDTRDQIKKLVVGLLKEIGE